MRTLEKAASHPYRHGPTVFIEYSCEGVPLHNGYVISNVRSVKLRWSEHQGCDVVVATPGRLLDMARNHRIDMTNVKYFVMDEADKMIQMGDLINILKIQALGKIQNF